MQVEHMSLKSAIDLLKDNIIKENVKEVRIEGDKLFILGKEREIGKYNQNTFGELGRAIAVIDLVKNKGIPASLIEIEVEGPSFGSKTKSRIDMIIKLGDTYDGIRTIAVGECKTRLKSLSYSEFRKFIKSQLLNVARLLSTESKLGYPLVMFFYEIVCNGTFVNSTFGWLNNIEVQKILETKLVNEDVLFNRQSTYIHNSSPTVFENKIYFVGKVLRKDNLKDISSPSAFKKLLTEILHQRLRKRGLIEDDAFYLISNILLSKIQDEIELDLGKKDEPDFQVRPDDYVNRNEFYNRINKLFTDAHIEILGEDPKSAEELELLKREDRIDILFELVPYIQHYRFRSLRNLNDDSIGDVFLDFMHEIFRQSKGMFFTHPNICRFVAKAVGVAKIKDDIDKGNVLYVLDPSCGSGTFLISALTEVFSGKSPIEIRKQAMKILYGIDASKDVISIAKVNMVMHGDGSANIYQQDALVPLSDLPFRNTKFVNVEKFEDGCTREVIKEGKGFDFILTNPPFSLNIKKDAVRHFVMKSFVFWNNGSTNASECFFVERWFQLLNENGRVGAVLPIAIFDSPEYSLALKLIICYFRIVAIIGLPEHAFQPFASQKTVLFFATRRSLKQANDLYKLLDDDKSFIDKIKDENIILYDIKNIGYRRVKRSKAVYTETIKENDLGKDIIRSIQDAFNDGKFSEYAVNIEDIYSKIGKLMLSPTFTVDISGDFTLADDGWFVVENFTEELSYDKLLCETGDIATMNGILLPKSFVSTTETNKVRIRNKINRGGFVLLKEGDVIIAPVRVYQGKIAVITKIASEKFLFSKDFIVLRRNNIDILKSIELMLTLLSPENIKRLESLSSIGKSGYPKIKDKKALLRLKLKKIHLQPKKLTDLASLYDNIYNVLYD
ncbi:MAG: N-6 DNA methylase [Candidatus Micrarchaeaceae archaeon]